MSHTMKPWTNACALALALATLNAGGTFAAPTSTPPATPVVSNVCSPDQCGQFGTCVIDTEGPLCICEPGYSGVTCETCDPYIERDRNGFCAAGPVCRTALCGGHGDCELAQGALPTCACDAGFTGARCDACEPGLVGADCKAPCEGTGCPAMCPPGRTGPGCTAALQVAGYRMSGHDQVLELGTSTTLTAEALGAGTHDRLVWKLVSGKGTLKNLGGGKATYTAPTSSALGYDTATVSVAPACCSAQGTTLAIGYKGPTMPWVTGVARPQFKVVDQALMRFMYDRCTGGAVLGINWKGTPIYRRGYGRNAGRSTPGRPGVDCGDVNPDATPVYPDSPVRIGSNTKAVTGAIVRRLVAGRLFSLGRLPDVPAQANASLWQATVDRIVEDVRVLDADLGLVPQVMRDILGTCTWDGPDSDDYTCTPGTQAPPAPLTVSDTTPPSSCGSNACYNNAQCTTNALANPPVFTCTCAAGFTGSTCRIATAGQNSVLTAQGVDRRWMQMTLGQLLSHQAGLPRSVISTTTILDNLFALRAAHDPNFDSLSDVGPALFEINDVFEEPAEGDPIQRMLEDRPSSFEYVLAETGRNLYNAPGATNGEYSNLGFVLLGVIVETMSDASEAGYGDIFGGSFTALGYHMGTPLEDFVVARLGGRPGDMNAWGATRSNFGMYFARSPNPLDPIGQQVDVDELEPRDWINGGWNPLRVDAKGIVCTPDEDGGCEWEMGIIDGYGNAGLVQFGMDGTLMYGSAGAIATESELYLRFMGQYRVGYDSNAPNYGRHRTSWSQTSSHSGLWDNGGARAWVGQIGKQIEKKSPDFKPVACNARKVSDANGTYVCPPGGTCCGQGYDCVNGGGLGLPVTVATQAVNQCVLTTSYRVPLTNAQTGDYQVDSSNFGTRNCVLPEGLDIFVATNQSTDGQDVPSPNSTTLTDYNYLVDAVLGSLCQVSWPVSPAALLPKGNNIQAMP